VEVGCSMAVKDTIQSIKNNVANAYTKLQDKGATIPTNKNIENLASTIDTVTGGGGTEDLSVELNAQDIAITQLENIANSLPDATIPEGTLLIQQNGVYDVIDYANVDVQVEVPTTPIEPPVLTIKEITENGTYNASDDNADGYSSVTVNVAGGGGEGITDGLARFIAGDVTLTELKASDFGNITKIANNAFTRAFTATMTKITLPNTITELGGSILSPSIQEIHFNEANIQKFNDVFSGASGLTNINNGIFTTSSGSMSATFRSCTKLNNIKINHNNTTNYNYCSYMCYQIGNSLGDSYSDKNAEYIYTGNPSTSSGSLNYNYAFNGAKMKKVEFTNLENFGASGSDFDVNYAFQYCYIENVLFPSATNMYSGSSGKRMFINSHIKRLKIPKLTNVTYMFYGTNYIDNIFFGENCSLAGTGTSYIPSSSKNFIPHTAIETYSQGTNWATLFANGGAEETRMFVYNNFTSGDTLPTQIGTTQVYNVTWYKDDDFTTLASGTATETKEYYGKITAVV
jgi:hypothetical protein